MVTDQRINEHLFMRWSIAQGKIDQNSANKVKITNKKIDPTKKERSKSILREPIEY